MGSANYGCNLIISAKTQTLDYILVLKSSSQFDLFKADLIQPRINARFLEKKNCTESVVQRANSEKLVTQQFI